MLCCAFLQEAAEKKKKVTTKGAAKGAAKGAKAPDAKPKSAPAPAATPAAATAAAAAPAADAVTAQAAVVRELKKKPGVTKEEIDAAVAILLELKADAGVVVDPKKAAAEDKKAKKAAAAAKQKENAEKAKAEKLAREASYPPEVKMAAEAVRVLKESGASKEDIKDAAEELVSLKKKHGLMGGAGPAKAAKGKEKGAKKAPVAAAVKTKAPVAEETKEQAAAPVAATAESKAAAPAAVAGPGCPNIHTLEGLAALDARLADFSYINGVSRRAVVCGCNQI